MLPDAPAAPLLVPTPSVLPGKGAAVCSPDSCSLSLLVPWELAWLDFFFDLLGESFFEAACAMSNLYYFACHDRQQIIII